MSYRSGAYLGARLATTIFKKYVPKWMRKNLESNALLSNKVFTNIVTPSIVQYTLTEGGKKLTQKGNNTYQKKVTMYFGRRYSRYGRRYSRYGSRRYGYSRYSRYRRYRRRF